MFWRYLFPGIVWLLLILLLSLTPGEEMPQHMISLVAFDKLMHWFFYGILTHLWLVGFKKQYRSLILKKRALWIVVPGVIIVGVLIEFTQGWIIPGRVFEMWDIVANIIGCAMGVLLFRFIYGKGTLF